MDPHMYHDIILSSITGTTAPIRPQMFLLETSRNLHKLRSVFYSTTYHELGNISISFRKAVLADFTKKEFFFLAKRTSFTIVYNVNQSYELWDLSDSVTVNSKNYIFWTWWPKTFTFWDIGTLILSEIDNKI